MTKEYLYESDLDNAKVLAALEKIDARVDKLTRDAAEKFERLQAAANAAFNVQIPTSAPIAAGPVPGAPPPVIPDSPQVVTRRVETVDQGLDDLADAERERARAAEAALEAIEASERERFDAARKVLASLTGEEQKRAANARDIIDAIRADEQRLSASRREDIARQIAAERARGAAAKEQIAEIRNVERQRLEVARQIGTAGTAGEKQRAATVRQQIATMTLEEQKRANVARAEITELTMLERRRSTVARAQIAEISREENKRARAAREAADAAGKAGGTRNLNQQAAAVAKVTAAYYLLIRSVEAAARAAVRFFTDLIKDSTRAAANIDSVGTSFDAIFNQAGPNVGATVLREIREEGLRLGVDLTGISRRILPLVGSVDQLKQIGEIVTELAALDPLQGVEGALVAINEALAGDVISLRRRFEIPTDDIRKLQQTKGLVQGLIEGLSQEIDIRGLGFETLEETADITFKRVVQRFNFLKEEFGTPILDELNDQFKVFLDFLGENDVQIQALVLSFGDLIAKVVELLGTGLNEFLTEDTLNSAEEFIVTLTEIVSLVESLSEMTFIPAPASDGAKRDLFDIKTALESLIRLVSIAKAGFAAFFSELRVEAKFLDDLLLGRISLEEFNRIAKEAGDAAFAEKILEGAEALEKAAEAGNVATESIENRKKAIEDATEADTAAADALLAQNLAQKALEEAQAALEEKQADVLADMAEAQKKYEEDVTDALRKAEQDRLDIIQEFAEKRVDAARDNARDIAKIFRENSRDIEKANLDLTRDEQDILRENNDKIEEIETESARNRIKIEEDYLHQIQDIRRRFDFDAEEAVRANDAVALLKIRRRMRFELDEARIDRDRKLDEEDQAREESLKKEREDQQKRLDEARLAHQRKLEDLQIALQAELEEQRIKYAEELEDLQIAEQRKQAELQQSLQRQLEELQLGLDRRLQELQSSLAAEVEAVRAAEQAKVEAMRLGTDMMQAELERRMALAQAAIARMNNLNAIGTPGNLGGSGHLAPQQPDIPINNQGTPGEAGTLGGGPSSSVFQPGGSGLSSYSPPASNGTSNVNYSTLAQIQIDLVDPSQLSPTQVAIIQNIILQTMQGVI